MKMSNVLGFLCGLLIATALFRIIWGFGVESGFKDGARQQMMIDQIQITPINPPQPLNPNMIRI